MAARPSALASPPQSLSIHLMSGVEGVDLNGGGSLGFHDAINAGTATNPVIQPYIQTGYFSVNSAAARSRTIQCAPGPRCLGHEIAEWLNDPDGDNMVPAWQEPAFPHICDNPFLEVGDPLDEVGHGFSVSLNGRTYQFPGGGVPAMVRRRSSFYSGEWLVFFTQYFLGPLHGVSRLHQFRLC